MADHADAIDTQQRRTTILLVIEASLQSAENWLQEYCSKPDLQILFDTAAHSLHHQADDTFGKLQDDVPGKTVTDDHIGRPFQDVTPLDVSNEVEARPRIMHQSVCLNSEIRSLRVFLADVQQTDPRIPDVKYLPGVHHPHQGELI